jgi:hypothetical protein
MGNEQQEQREPTQLSQPKKGKPITIPVPKRDDFEQLVTRAANTAGDEDEKPAAT